MLYDAGKDSHLNIEGLMIAVYKLSTRIRSNVPTDSLLYDLCIYRMDSSRNKYCLIDVKQQPFSGTYETQTHMTGNVDELYYGNESLPQNHVAYGLCDPRSIH